MEKVATFELSNRSVPCILRNGLEADGARNWGGIGFRRSGGIIFQSLCSHRKDEEGGSEAESTMNQKKKKKKKIRKGG